MSFTQSLARGSGRRPWRTVIIWVLTLVAAVGLTSQLLGDALTSSITFTDEPESITASNLIEEVKGEPTDTEFVVVTSEGIDISDPVYAAYVTEIESTLLGLGPDLVTSVGTYLSETGPVSESGLSALLPVVVAGDGVDETGVNAEVVRDTLADVPAPDGFQALMAGPATLNSDFNTIAEEDLRTGETIGIAVALVVLVLVFGSVVSGVIPVILGVVAIGIAMGLAALLGLFMDLSFFITNMITMIGLAVGIDYSLFIVSRYREERLHGFEKLDAISRAGATATRAVFFSGLTVVLALVGLLILPNTLFRALGLGAILVVLVAVLASMTLLPAVLSLLGDRIESLRVRRRRTMDEQGRMWDRITKTVMGRPVLSIVFAAGILLLAASSLFSINKGLSGVSTLPDEMESKQAFEILATEFAGGFTSPIEVVVTGSDLPETLANLESDVAADGGFGPAIIDPLSTDDVAVLSVQTLGDVNSIESQEALRHLRADIVPGAVVGETEVFVGGETAITVDFLDQVDDYTPIVFTVVLGLSFILLMLAFRSLVIPAKAIAMNLLSVGAAYGLVVATFQADVGPVWIKEFAGFLGFEQVETIEAWLPLFLFSILFGLSMDYHVFLLSRIKERFDQTGNNTESVAYGLRTTGALITGAAIIMVAVFAGFAAGRLVMFQQLGFGLAIAVLLDATIVRSVLVPASMKLLGNRNWYFPTWLEWIPNISIEGHIDEVVPQATVEPAPA
ncbi:MAG TPA: MMPL family transporter [Acidimicrobiia bacterium]|nr:MMPL family transporter [Acidimicrobiia bacterium]